MGSVPASQVALQKAGLSIQKIDLPLKVLYSLILKRNKSVIDYIDENG